MGRELCVPEEHWVELSDHHSSIFQIKYEELDWFHDLERIAGPFWEYWKTVMHEDLSDLVDFEVHGVKMPVTRAHQMLLSLQGQRVEGVLATCEGEVVGFLLYHLVAGCILYIRAEWVDSRFTGKGIGQEMAELTAPLKRIKKIIFKTNNKKSEDAKILRIAKERAQLIDDHDGFRTWEMTWDYGWRKRRAKAFETSTRAERPGCNSRGNSGKTQTKSP